MYAFDLLFRPQSLVPDQCESTCEVSREMLRLVREEDTSAGISDGSRTTQGGQFCLRGGVLLKSVLTYVKKSLKVALMSGSAGCRLMERKLGANEVAIVSFR